MVPYEMHFLTPVVAQRDRLKPPFAIKKRREAGGAIVRACGACSTNRHVPADVELIIKQNSRLISENKTICCFPLEIMNSWET